MTELMGERLKLREFKFDDWRTIQQEYAADTQVTEYMIWGPNTEQATKDFVRQAMGQSKDKPRSSFEFAIVVSDKLIGGCGLRIVHHEYRAAEVGYVLGRRYWGEGYAVEAAQLLFQLAFKELLLHRIYAICNALNLRSERVMQKLGMRKEGHFLKDRFVKEQWIDTCLYAILADEWGKTEGK